MRRLDARLRPLDHKLSAWLRANKLRAALVWIVLILLSSVARVSVGGVSGHVLSYIFLMVSILLLMAYFRGGRA